MKFFRNISIVAVAAGLALTGCKKDFLDRKPTGQAALEDVFTSVSGARAAVNGIHRLMYSFGGDQHYEFGQASINMMFDLMGEDFIQNGQGHFNPMYNWNASMGPTALGTYMWSFYFQIINNANIIIANIDKVPGDQADKNEIKAQALSYRAFAYYQLANCYSFSYKMDNQVTIRANNSLNGYTGNVLNSPCVPLYTEPTQVAKGRATVQEVYTQINKDLDEAIALFDAGVPRVDKSQINGDVARGLSARVALVMQNWPKAATMAHEARANANYMNGSSTLLGFNDINNNEWIWGLAINAEQATIYASYVSFMDRQSGGYALIHCQMVGLNEMVNTWMDSTDSRKGWWLTRTQVTSVPPGADSFYFKNKYKQYEQLKFRIRSKGSFAADYPLMRAGEMALIEAEALAQQNQLANAKTVLDDFIKTRNPNYSSVATNSDTLIKQIWRQRRIELWGEGFRYFDIKRQSAPFARVGRINGLLRVGNVGPLGVNIRTVTAEDMRFLFRIPGAELNQNKFLLQNL
jgi:hypothetical protein